MGSGAAPTIDVRSFQIGTSTRWRVVCTSAIPTNGGIDWSPLTRRSRNRPCPPSSSLVLESRRDLPVRGRLVAAATTQTGGGRGRVDGRAHARTVRRRYVERLSGDAPPYKDPIDAERRGTHSHAERGNEGERRGRGPTVPGLSSGTVVGASAHRIPSRLHVSSADRLPAHARVPRGRAGIVAV